jgi:hypothetical protein
MTTETSSRERDTSRQASKWATLRDKSKIWAALRDKLAYLWHLETSSRIYTIRDNLAFLWHLEASSKFMHLRQDRDETLRQAQDLWQYRDKLEDLWRPRTFMYSWQLKTSFAIYGNSRQVCVDEDNSETSSMYLWHLETRSRFMTPSRQARVYMTSRQARRFMSPRDKLEYLWPRDKLAYLWQFETSRIYDTSRQAQRFMTPRDSPKI